MNADQPLVSVIIATCNRPVYLSQAITSVLNGVYRNFEIIVTDDAGPEVNRQIAESFRDPRIRYRRNATRLGGTGNHREALKLALGEYIGLLNDDDQWEPEFLSSMVPILNSNSDVVIAFSDHWVIDSQGSLARETTEEYTHRYKRDSLAPGFHRPIYRLALIDQTTPMVASLLRAGPIDWQDSPLETSSLYDYWVTYLAARTGMGAWYVPQRLARYRKHGGNESSVGGERIAKPGIQIFSRLIADHRLEEIKPDLGGRLLRAHYGYGIYLLKNGRTSEARTHFLAAMPNIRAALALTLSYVPNIVRSSFFDFWRRHKLRGRRWFRIPDQVLGSTRCADRAALQFPDALNRIRSELSGGKKRTKTRA
jgi:glycosyltransferase involved in cell wall biosynthesis